MKLAVIRKEKGEYCVRSPNNPDWSGGCYKSKDKAEERLKAVEYFKRQADRVASRYLVAMKGDVELPDDHVAAMKVPKGGSSCSTCTALSKDKKHCGNPFFQKWRKSLGAEDPSLLPEPADSYCSDWYEQAT